MERAIQDLIKMVALRKFVFIFRQDLNALYIFPSCCSAAVEVLNRA